ncbi:MAG: allophanate hydrolase, partial [Pseudohongiellaceae bacterium]
MPSTLGWTLDDWKHAYASGESPQRLLQELVDSLQPDDVAWIATIDPAGLDQALAALERLTEDAGGAAALPLYGVPYVVK